MSTNVSAKTKGWIKNNKTGAKYEFMFNPTDFEYSRGSEYVDITAPGMAYPDTQFVKGKAREFPVTLYLYDSPYTGKIYEATGFLGRFLTPETNTKNYTRPPDMTFCMGPFVRKCVLLDLNIKITRYNSDLLPLEATLTLNLRQVGV